MNNHARIYVGIDPGKSGGIARLVVHNGKESVTTCRMPERLDNLLEAVSLMTSNAHFVALERVSGFIGKAHPGSRMFSFGRSYGALEMALVACQVAEDRCVKILPHLWQAELGLIELVKGKKIGNRKKTKESKTEFKNRLKDAARRMFPGSYLTLKTCDALLLAEYARRISESINEKS